MYFHLNHSMLIFQIILKKRISSLYKSATWIYLACHTESKITTGLIPDLDILRLKFPCLAPIQGGNVDTFWDVDTLGQVADILQRTLDTCNIHGLVSFNKQQG